MALLNTANAFVIHTGDTFVLVVAAVLNTMPVLLVVAVISDAG